MAQKIDLYQNNPIHRHNQILFTHDYDSESKSKTAYFKMNVFYKQTSHRVSQWQKKRR